MPDKPRCAPSKDVTGSGHRAATWEQGRARRGGKHRRHRAGGNRAAAGSRRWCIGLAGAPFAVNASPGRQRAPGSRTLHVDPHAGTRLAPAPCARPRSGKGGSEQMSKGGCGSRSAVQRIGEYQHLQLAQALRCGAARQRRPRALTNTTSPAPRDSPHDAPGPGSREEVQTARPRQHRRQPVEQVSRTRSGGGRRPADPASQPQEVACQRRCAACPARRRGGRRRHRAAAARW